MKVVEIEITQMEQLMREQFNELLKSFNYTSARLACTHNRRDALTLKTPSIH